MTKYCGECSQECGVEKEDLSYDHEFGTEWQYAYFSDCCCAELYDHQCDDCKGLGYPDTTMNAFIVLGNAFKGLLKELLKAIRINYRYTEAETIKCESCNGKGVYGESEIDSDDDLIDFDALSKDERGEIADSLFIK